MSDQNPPTAREHLEAVLGLKPIVPPTVLAAAFLGLGILAVLAMRGRR
jgi:hypothetical protein